MIREPRNNFDEHIKEALQGFEMPFEPDDWALMEQRLNTETGQTGLVLFFSNKYLQVGIAAALLICVLYHANSWLSDANFDLAQQEQTAKQISPIASNQTATTQDLSEEMTRLLDDKNKAKNDMTTKENAVTDIVLADEKTEKNMQWSKNNKQSAALFDVSLSTEAKTNHTIISYDKKNTFNVTSKTNLVENTENFEQFAAPTNAIVNHQPNFQTATIQTSLDKPNFAAQDVVLPAENMVENSKDNDALQKLKPVSTLTEKVATKSQIFPLAHKNAILVEENNTLLATIETAQPSSDFSSVIKTPKVPRKKATLSIGSYSSLDINFLEANFPEAGLTKGLGLHFGKNKRWGFQTGAFYTYKNYPTYEFAEETPTVSSTNFMESADFVSSRSETLQKQYDIFNIRAFFVEIPFLITHNFNPNAAINPYLAAGTSIWLPTSMQKTSYKSQIIATYDYVTAVQEMNERDPNFMLINHASMGEDSTAITTNLVEENTDYINTIPEYYTSVNEEAVNETVGKSRVYWDILQIQAGLDVKMSKRWSLQVAGQLKGSLFKHALNRDAIQHLSSVDKRLHTIGLQVGFTCAL